MIPRLIHRIWIGGPMPAEFRRNGARWEALHPGWKLCDWDGALPEMRNAALFDDAKRHTPGDWKRWQADVLRLEILWRFGGVYVDTDVEPLRPLDELLEGIDCFAGYSPNRGPAGERLLTNAVMGAVAEHPFIGACIAELPAAVVARPGQRTAKVVGPWHISRVHEAGEWPGVTTFDEAVLYPQRDADGEAWTRHAWANTRDRGGK